MAVLEWGDTAPPYQHGVDRGLIELDGEIKVWNGLVSVNEAEINAGELTSQFDGRTFVNMHLGGNFQATVSAFGFVPGFEAILGFEEVVPGFFLTGQRKRMFNFSYRTKVAEDHYKIHLVYNVMATPLNVRSRSLSEDVEIEERQWRLDTVPLRQEEQLYKPYSHVIIDSRLFPEFYWNLLNDALYGTDSTDPTFLLPF